MLILNIHGPINAGKSTVSKKLVEMFDKACFIEVDELMSDEEQAALGLSMPQGWAERCRRLENILQDYIKTRPFETVIFAYPLADNTYKKWSSFQSKDVRFLNITIAPRLEVCLQNRGSRVLSAWEKKRIEQMYQEGYQDRPYADFVINNENQTPEQTARLIKGFVESALSSGQQWLHLVERRWPALVKGEKTSTFRLGEGFVHKGFLLYKDCPREQRGEVVYVTSVYYLPFAQAVEVDGFDAHTPDLPTALKQMQAHYPDLTLQTPILLVRHLSVPETRKLYPNEVAQILNSINAKSPEK